MSKIKTFTTAASLAVASALLPNVAGAADLGVMPVKAPVIAPAPTPLWDVAFGGAVMSDYNFRGVSQSDRGISGTFYVEPRLNLGANFQLYAGIQPYATKLPTNPIGEFDGYGGIRATFGPVTFDVGGIYYYYPNERQQFTDFSTIVTTTPVVFGNVLTPLTVRDTDFAEVYGKVSWTINDYFAVGGYVYYSDNYLNSGAHGLYYGGTAKITAPSTFFPSDIGAYISGEVAYYDLGTTGATLGFVNLPNYLYYNVGLALTYKALTLDLRYHDTDLSRGQCFALTGDPRGVFNGGNSRWCSDTFIAKLSVDTTLNAIK